MIQSQLVENNAGEVGEVGRYDDQFARELKRQHSEQEEAAAQIYTRGSLTLQSCQVVEVNQSAHSLGGQEMSKMMPISHAAWWMIVADESTAQIHFNGSEFRSSLPFSQVGRLLRVLSDEAKVLIRGCIISKLQINSNAVLAVVNTSFDPQLSWTVPEPRVLVCSDARSDNYRICHSLSKCEKMPTGVRCMCEHDTNPGVITRPGTFPDGYDCIREWTPACGYGSPEDALEAIGGQYYNNGSCKTCQKGFFQRRDDQFRKSWWSNCVVQINGHAALNSSDDKCQNPTSCESALELGYVDSTGAHEAKPCPENSYVPLGGDVTSIQGCVCKEGFFVDRLANWLPPQNEFGNRSFRHWVCTPCPANAVCVGTTGDNGPGTRPWYSPCSMTCSLSIRMLHSDRLYQPASCCWHGSVC